MLKRYVTEKLSVFRVNVFIGVYFFQAFINTAKEIYQKIQDGVFDVTNEVCFTEVYFTGCKFSWTDLLLQKIKTVKNELRWKLTTSLRVYVEYPCDRDGSL